MSSVTSCESCQYARADERRKIQEEAIPGKAKKTATTRTALGLYVAGHTPKAVKTGVVAGALMPQAWAKDIEEYSDSAVNWTLKKLPDCAKSHISKVYLMHVAWEAADQSVPVITPMINVFELAIGFKLGVQGSNRAKELVEMSPAKRSLPRKVVDSVGACASTYAFAHMITKPQNITAAAAGGTVTATFPRQMEVIHNRVDSAVSKLPAEASIMMCGLYAAHEVYFNYLGGTVPYVSECVALAELGASFYAGVKYFLHNERQATETLKQELPKIEEIE